MGTTQSNVKPVKRNCMETRVLAVGNEVNSGPLYGVNVEVHLSPDRDPISFPVLWSDSDLCRPPSEVATLITELIINTVKSIDSVLQRER